MRPGNKWLSISLFCSKHHWFYLLQNGILPHVTQLCREGRVKNYCLEFNGTNGENVRLPLLVCANDASNVARQIHDHFTSYFSTLPVNDNKKDDHARKLFMDFPCNTIQYGLYSVQNGDPVLQQRLSEIIIEALCTEVKDDTFFVRLAFYLYVTLLQVATKNTGQSFKQLLVIEYCFYTDLGEMEEAVIIKQFFEGNKLLLFDTCYDLLKLREGLPAWVYQWATVCETKFKDCLINNHSLSGRKAVFTEIASYIDKQLNVSTHAKLLLFHFIRQVTSV